jgi:predicted DNA-binding transcriptional regulator AlpA
MTFNTPEPYWNDRAVAQFYNVSTSKIRRWRREGKGPKWVRIGGAIRYNPLDVKDFLESLPSGGSLQAAAQ